MPAYRPARSRRSPPVGFVVPCAPILVSRPPSGPDWIHEPKYDGYRMLARKDGAAVRLWSRNRKDWTDALAGIAAAIGALPCSSIVLDGEAVVMLPDGRQDFHALRGRDGCRAAQLVAYDVLHLDEEDLRRLPLDRRREILRGILHGADGHLVMSEALDEDGPAVFRAACGLGLEGIVSKRRDAPYRSGRSAALLKSKSATYTR